MKSSLFLLLLLLGTSGCYSLKGISIDPETDTFYVLRFENTSNNVVPTLSQDFTEALREKIKQESRLKLRDTDPDIDFSGSITDFRVTSEAPEPGETTSFSRLTIRVSVIYTNNRKEDDTWTKSFEYFDNFEANQNLLDVQDQLIANISQELVDRIFNAAFTNW